MYCCFLPFLCKFFTKVFLNITSKTYDLKQINKYNFEISMYILQRKNNNHFKKTNFCAWKGLKEDCYPLNQKIFLVSRKIIKNTS